MLQFSDVVKLIALGVEHKDEIQKLLQDGIPIAEAVKTQAPSMFTTVKQLVSSIVGAFPDIAKLSPGDVHAKVEDHTEKVLKSIFVPGSIDPAEIAILNHATEFTERNPSGFG